MGGGGGQFDPLLISSSRVKWSGGLVLDIDTLSLRNILSHHTPRSDQLKTFGIVSLTVFSLLMIIFEKCHFWPFLRSNFVSDSKTNSYDIFRYAAVNIFTLLTISWSYFVAKTWSTTNFLIVESNFPSLLYNLITLRYGKGFGMPMLCLISWFRKNYNLRFDFINRANSLLP